MLHAYLDGELDSANAVAVEQRIAGDAAFAAERDRIEALRDVVARRLPRVVAPPALRQRIERSIGARRFAPPASWRALAASVAATAVIASGLTWVAVDRAQPDMTQDAVLAAHIRALMAPQPADVASSDRHTVKPWFSGRIPQAPRVVDLAADGFPLAGGRIDVVGQSPVPTLVYRRRQHLISLFALPGSSQSSTAPRNANGYNIAQWSDGGVSYWAISDLNAAELVEFSNRFRAAAL